MGRHGEEVDEPDDNFALEPEDLDEPPHQSFRSGSGWWATPAWRDDEHARAACGEDGGGGLRSEMLAVSRVGRPQQASSNRLQRNKWINRQVTQSSNNMQMLLQTIHYHIAEMNSINMVTALHRVTKLAVSGNTEYTVDRVLNEPCFKQLFGLVAQQIESSATEAPNGQPQTPPFEVQCMSMVCWSCATLRLAEQRLLCIIADITGPRLSELKSFELSNLIWAYAKLSMGIPQLFAAVAGRMMHRKENEFSLQCLSMVVWSFATAKQKDNTLFRSLAVEVHSKAADAKPQAIANTLWAYAKNRSVEAPLFKMLADVALSNNLLWTFKPQELSNTVWSFATVALRHEPLCQSMLAVVISKRWSLNPQNISNILWAYSKLELGKEAGQLVPELLYVSLRKLPQHKPQELSAIVWAASRDSPTNWHFFETAANICARRLHEFPPHALAYMVEAYATIEQGALASAFSEAMVRESLGRLHQFELSSLTHLLAGVVKFTESSEGLCQAGHQAEHARNVDALRSVCLCIAGQVGDLQDVELPFLLKSLQLLPERSGGARRARGLLEVVAAEEERRARAPGRQATRPARRATAALCNKTLGEIAARGEEAPQGPHLPWWERQTTHAATASHETTTGPAGTCQDDRSRAPWREHAELAPDGGGGVQPWHAAADPADVPMTKLSGLWIHGSNGQARSEPIRSDFGAPMGAAPPPAPGPWNGRPGTGPTRRGPAGARHNDDR